MTAPEFEIKPSQNEEDSILPIDNIINLKDMELCEECKSKLIAALIKKLVRTDEKSD